MIEFLLSLSTWTGSLVAMTLSAASGLLVYFVSSKLISMHPSETSSGATSNLFRVIGMLVSLMLSLTFAEVIIELRAVTNAIQREVLAISDAFKDLRWFDAQGTREIQEYLIDYAQAVVDDDWPALANDRLGERTGELKRQIAESVMNLKPASPLQEKLWSRILADVDAMSANRLIRLDNASSEPPVFVYVVAVGFLLTMMFFGAYPPQTPLVALVTLYTMFLGLVLYLTVSMSDPFHGGINVEPAAFDYLAKEMRSELN